MSIKQVLFSTTLAEVKGYTLLQVYKGKGESHVRFRALGSAVRGDTYPEPPA